MLTFFSIQINYFELIFRFKIGFKKVLKLLYAVKALAGNKHLFLYKKGLFLINNINKSKSNCWAFAAAGALEAAIFKQYNTLVTLSPQLLTDCDKNSNACDGGIGTFGI